MGNELGSGSAGNAIEGSEPKNVLFVYCHTIYTINTLYMVPTFQDRHLQQNLWQFGIVFGILPKSSILYRLVYLSSDRTSLLRVYRSVQDLSFIS